MNCPVCSKHPAIIHPILGVLPCEECKKRRSKMFPDSLGTPYEFTTENIRQNWKKYAKSQLQRFRGGEFSKEWRDANPHQAQEMVKRGIITQEQHDKAKPVWRELGREDQIAKSL